MNNVFLGNKYKYILLYPYKLRSPIPGISGIFCFRTSLKFAVFPDIKVCNSGVFFEIFRRNDIQVDVRSSKPHQKS